MKNVHYFLMLLMAAALFISSDKPAYNLFKGDGERSDYDKMLKEVLDADIILFGELHDNPVIHWLELELTKSVYAEKKQKLILGMEMFEADDQLKINEYFAGSISEKSFEDEARIWKNYKTDYKPIVLFGKSNSLSFIATNIPRRYASFVAKKGLDSLMFLSPEAKNYMAPLPIEVDLNLPGYKSMPSGGMSHGVSHLAEAQAVKDATMSYFILKNYSKGKIFLHFNGAYHSNNYEGIVWFLKKANKSLKIVTISAVEQSDISKLSDENMKLSDFIIVIDDNMTKTN